MKRRNNVLTIDLTNRRYSVDERPDLFNKYMGGAGVGIKLLEENCPQGADPLGPDNPIIFTVGPLTGLYPLASKTVAMFKSPLTGNLGESHAGGRSAVAIGSAGYGAIVIKGKSESPVYISINNEVVKIRDASGIWGIVNSTIVGRIIRELETGGGMRTIMRIGGAGEKMVKYACVTTETYRHFGRLGLGAVFGSKMLKAICISGGHSVSVKDPKSYRTTYDEVYKKAVESTLMKKYHDYGTAANIVPLNMLKGLPTRNLNSASSPEAENISGENLAEKYLGRRVACAHCPVACIHVAALREPYETELFFYKTTMIPYDYELIYALGSMVGVFDVEDMLKLIDKVEIYGVDAMSIGVVLAWATEAQEKRLVSTDETMGLELKWGYLEGYLRAIENIVSQKNEFYKCLASGLDVASARYGGEDYALAFGGNEMPGYHTGPAAHISHLVGSRHSHLDAGGYSVDQNILKGNELTDEETVDKLLAEESWRQVLSSLVVCFFARGIFDAETVVKLLAVTGHDMSVDDLSTFGRMVHKMKYDFKVREGFNPGQLRIPKRIFETSSARGMVEEETIRSSIKSFFAKLESS
jgi:aldehyde:ferredoxin oxidoreductase